MVFTHHIASHPVPLQRSMCVNAPYRSNSLVLFVVDSLYNKQQTEAGLKGLCIIFVCHGITWWMCESLATRHWGISSHEWVSPAVCCCLSLYRDANAWRRRVAMTLPCSHDSQQWKHKRYRPDGNETICPCRWPFRYLPVCRRYWRLRQIIDSLWLLIYTFSSNYYSISFVFLDVHVFFRPQGRFDHCHIDLTLYLRHLGHTGAELCC